MKRAGLALSPPWGEGGGLGRSSRSPTRPCPVLLPRPFGERAGVRGSGRSSASGCGRAPVLLPRPFGERVGVRGFLALESLTSFASSLALHASAGRDVRPAAHLLSFASPKESRQRKGDPTDRVPSLRCGQPAMLARGAVLRNSLCSLRSRRSDNRSKSDHDAWACSAPHARPTPCASRHGQRGLEPQSGPSLRSAPVLAFARAERSDGPCGFPSPLRLRLRRSACGVARAAQHARVSWSGSRGMFERRERSEQSEFHRAPRKRCDAGWPRSEAQGSQTWGRFVFA